MFDNCLSHCCKVLVSAVNLSRCAAHFFIAPWELRHSNHAQLHPVNLQCLEAYVPNIQSPELHQCTCICNYKMYGLIPALSLMSRLLPLPNHHRRQCSIISNLKESIKVLNLGISSLTWTWGVWIVQSFNKALYSFLYIHWNVSISSAVSSAICIYHSILFLT